MAAAETILYLDNGQCLSIYNDASPINTPMHCSISGTASATSPYDFVVASNTRITDIITTATAGQVEVYNQGQPTGKIFNTDARYVISIANRKKYVPKIGFLAGVKYQIIPRIQTS